MQMEMYMKETGQMIRLRVKESTLTWMEPDMKATGRKISSMERGENHGQTQQNMKETM